MIILYFLFTYVYESLRGTEGLFAQLPFKFLPIRRVWLFQLSSIADLTIWCYLRDRSSTFQNSQFILDHPVPEVGWVDPNGPKCHGLLIPRGRQKLPNQGHSIIPILSPLPKYVVVSCNQVHRTVYWAWFFSIFRPFSVKFSEQFVVWLTQPFTSSQWRTKTLSLAGQPFAIAGAQKCKHDSWRKNA